MASTAAGKVYTVHTIFKAINDMTQPFSRMNKSAGKFEQKMHQINDRMSSSFNKTAISLIGITVGLSALAREAGFVEKSIVRMSTKFGGSTDEAKNFVRKLQDLAADTPLTIKPVIKSADVLLSQGIDSNDVIPTLMKLGDIAQGDDAVLESISLGFSRVYSEDRITREHLDRFVFNGVPVYRAMADNMKITQGQLSVMIERGELGRDALVEAIDSMTSQDGMFYRSMEKQINTFSGAFTQLVGKIQRQAQVVGSIFTPILKEKLQYGSKYLDYATKRFEETFSYIYKIDKINIRKDENGRDIYQNGVPLIESVDRTELFGSKAHENVVKKIQEFFDVFKGVLPNIDTIITNLSNGSSFFYTFMDCLTTLAEVLKSLIPFIEVLITLIAKTPKWLINIIIWGGVLIGLLAKIAIFILSWKTFFVILIKLGSLFKAIFGVIIGKMLLVILSALKAALLALFSVVGAVIAGVIIAGVVLHLLYQKFEGFRNVANKVVDFIENIIEKLLEFAFLRLIVVPYLQSIVNVFRSVFLGDIPSLLLNLVKLIIHHLLLIPKLFLEGISSIPIIGDTVIGDTARSWIEALETPSNSIQNIIDERLEKLEITINDNTSDKFDTNLSTNNVFGTDISFSGDNNKLDPSGYYVPVGAQ